MNMQMLGLFIKESGLRKVGSGLAMFAGLAWLLYVKALPAENFTSLAMVIIVTLMGANAFEHHVKEKAKKPEGEPSPQQPGATAPEAAPK